MTVAVDESNGYKTNQSLGATEYRPNKNNKKFSRCLMGDDIWAGPLQCLDPNLEMNGPYVRTEIGPTMRS